MVSLKVASISCPKHIMAYAVLLCAGLADLAIGAEQPPQTVKIANAGEPATLDPHKYNLRLEETLLNDLFTGLTAFDKNGGIMPGVAERWTTSADGLTWTFYLRDSARWSDGEPLTAHDFVFALRRLQDPATAASLAYFMDMLKHASAINRGERPAHELGATATDAHTLVLELEKPYPYLLERLLYPTAFPVPRHMLERHGADWVKPEHFVSNGAYTLDSWIPQAHITLTRNPQFRAAPEIQRVQYVPITNEQAAYNRFRSGEIHAIGNFPVGELAGLKADQHPGLRISGLLSMFYLVFNTREPPLDNVTVRQALSLAIDQQTLTGQVMRSGSTPATSFVPDLLADYQGVVPPHENTPYAQRLQQARELLEDAGFSKTKPLSLVLRHVSGIENKKVNLAISGMWRQIGVNTRLQQADVRTHFADLRQGDFQVGWAGWVGENNAEHYLSLLQSDIGDVNYGGFADPVFDSLMGQAQQQADRMRRNDLLHSAEAVAVHYYPVVPLYSAAVRRLVDPRLGGWENNPRDMHPTRYLYWQPPGQTN